MFEALAVVGVNVYAGMEGEAVLGSTQGAGFEGGGGAWRGAVAVYRAASGRAEGDSALDRCGGDEGQQRVGLERDIVVAGAG